LIVQQSSGLYYAAQYDGTNGAEIVAALRATDVRSAAGVLTFRSFIMRAGGLLTSGHRFSVPLGHWIVWADEGNPYVIAPPLTTAEFQQQYQVAATAAQVTALSATVAALGLTVTALDASLVVTNANVTNLTAALGATNADVAALDAALVVTNANVTSLGASVTALDTNIHNIDAAWIVSGILPYQRLAGTIAENATIALFNRPTLVNPGTASDCWRWLYNGTRTIYGNEFNLLRVRGVPEDHAVRDGLSTAIVQASLSDASSHLFQVLGNGDILAAGGLSMLPTAPVAVTFNGAAGTANAVTISDGSASGTPYPVTTTYNAADNRVYLDGSVANPTGVSIPGGTTLFTVTAAHRPVLWAQCAGRTSTNLAAKITIKPTGAVVLDQALAAAATISFDGHNWRKA
jgi:hypothetical protein